MEIQKRTLDNPVFSVCIPQYNRTRHLIEVCASLVSQTFRDFEVCISDDCSTDGREGDLLAFLNRSGLSFIYRRQERNARYDGNLRASIALASGRYCFLLGNDDSLATTDTLANLYADLCSHGPVGVAITNYEEFVTGHLYTRMPCTRIVGRGPVVAARAFRTFSFVSGVVLDRSQAQALATSRWDGSEMYQMYIGCRIIAEGGALLGVNRVAIRKNLLIADEQVESYASKLAHNDKRIIERKMPLNTLGQVVADAVSPSLAQLASDHTVAWVFLQILLFTYPYWIIEYRRAHSWQYALGVCLGMRPHNLLLGIDLLWPMRVVINIVYILATLGGLLVPLPVFNLFHSRLYALAKSI
jgi:glycosyltransferase involved in cell wall biosynthesis